MTPDRSIDPSPKAASLTSSPPTDRQLSTRQRLVYLLVLVALAVLPYINSLRNSFVYDDYDQVLVNPYIRNFHHLREIFTTSVWSFMGDFRGSTNYYRPVMTLGYMVCYRLFGINALGFHAANVLANLGVVLLVFLVTFKMFRSHPVALAAACIYALHPIHSEAVEWIAAVTELELALFYLLTFGFFIASARKQGGCSTRFQIAMAVSYLFALFSKEQALTLPLLAALYEHFFRDDRRETTWIQKLRRYAVLWLLPGVYLVLRARYLGGFAPSLFRPGFGIEAVTISALALVGRYCWKLLWPAELCAYYVFPSDVSALWPWALGGIVALAICALTFVSLRKSNPQAAFGVIWLLAILAPVLNVRWMASNPFAERYLYLASVGFCWIVGWAGVGGWNWLTARGKPWRIALPLVLGIIATLCVFRIVTRNRDWRNNVTFYIATLASSPDAYIIHNNLGTLYWEEGNISAAAKEWQTTLRLAPTFEYALHNLGLVANEEKNYRDAETLFLRALEIRPNYSDAHLDLGKTYEAIGKLQEAEAQLLTAESLSPLNDRTHDALSEFYLDQRRLPEAEAEARRSLEIRPTLQGYWDLGWPELLKGDRTGAEHAFLAAEALVPTDGRAHFILGLFYRVTNRTGDAIREYRTGLQFDPANADALANLKKLESPDAQHP